MLTSIQARDMHPNASAFFGTDVNLESRSNKPLSMKADVEMLLEISFTAMSASEPFAILQVT